MSFHKWLRKTWEDYETSFDVEEAIKESSPAMTGLVALTFLAGTLTIWLIPGAKSAIGLRYPYIPLGCLAVAVIATSLTFFTPKREITRIAVLQIVDVSFYAGSIVSLAALSKSPASLGFIAFYAVMCLRWARFYALTLVACLSVSAVPAIFVLSFNADIETSILLFFAISFFVYMSNSNTERRKIEVRVSQSMNAIANLDTIISETSTSSISELRAHASAMIHKIKNELVPTSMCLSDMLEELGSDAALEKQMLEGIQSIDNAIKDIETFLRKLNSGSGEPEVLHLQDLRDLLAQEFNGEKVKIGEFSHDTIHGKAEPLVLAFENLVSNALEAGAQTIEITQKDDMKKNKILITLKDDGPGLPKAIMDNLFRPFNTSDKRGGLGLGIYLSARIIESCGGKITLSNSSESGTAYEMEFKQPAYSDTRVALET